MNSGNNAKSIMIQYCRKLYDKGLMPGKDGNVSLRVDQEMVIVTPSGVCKGTVTEDELVFMKVTGEVISGSKQSSETPMHLAAYKIRKDAGAVIHAHRRSIGAFALAGKPIDTRYAPFAYLHLGKIGSVPYITPGSAGLHEAVAEALSSGHAAIILLSHGSLVIGRDIQDAVEKLDMLEAYADMLLKAQLLGGAKILSDKELGEITQG